MSKKIFAVLLMLMLVVPICQSQASTTYTFNFTENYLGDGVTELNDKISAFECSISGIAGVNWIIDNSSIVGDYATNWFFGEGPGNEFTGVEINFPGVTPLTTGPVLNIISIDDTPLNLSGFIPYTFNGPEYTAGSYSASLDVASVPIPGALWLLGSGLVGMVGVRRKLGKA